MPWMTIAAELSVTALVLAVLALDLTLPKTQQHRLGGIVALGLLFAGGILLNQVPSLGQSFGPLFVLDRLAFYFKVLFLGTAFIVVLMTREFTRRMERGVGEFYLLLLLATVGTFVLASVQDFVLLFVAVELLTFSLYVMTAYLRTEAASIEAGLKYLILGAVASAVLLYGITFLYGTTGTTSFAALRSYVQHQPSLPTGVVVGFLLVVSGLAFKIAAVPFHLWVPDVYQGAPTPITAFLSVGSKAAGFVVLIRLLNQVFFPAQPLWAGLMAAFSAMTMCYGNLAAIPQTNIKRLLGYSSIGHAGYVLMGLAAASTLGTSGAVFYLSAYAFTNLAAFLVIVVVSSSINSDAIDDYAGLHERSPFLAAAMFIALLSLAGVPPLAGFFGKFLLLWAAMDRGLLWLVVIGAINVAISLYYYLLVVKRIYLTAPASHASIPVPAAMRFAILFCLAGIIGLGIFQAPIYDLAYAAVSQLF